MSIEVAKQGFMSKEAVVYVMARFGMCVSHEEDSLLP